MTGVKTLQKIDLYSNFNREGMILVKLVHAFDISFLIPGTVIYGSFKISSSKIDPVESETATVGDNDCIWDGGADGSVNVDHASRLLLKG